MDIQTAQKWYRWLWLSPLLTIPTLLAIFSIIDPYVFKSLCPSGYFSCRYGFEPNAISAFVAVILSSFWHLILLIPALNRQDNFVRWHGIQALILAGLRTAVPLVSIFIFLAYDSLITIFLLFPLWLFGTVWGQQQARRGDCSLMRWIGRADLLPGPPEKSRSSIDEEKSVEALENTFFSSEDPQERQAALAELKKCGLVESL